MKNRDKFFYKKGSELDVCHQEHFSSPSVFYDAQGYVNSQSRDELLKYHPEVVLVSPQIPQNTGSIARLCAAFSLTLHLVEPMAFQITEKSVLRAGLDYWEHVNLFVHEDFLSLYRCRPKRRFLFVETGNGADPFHFHFVPGDMLVFGAETFGIPSDIMDTYIGAGKGVKLTLPMFQRGVRSINLANTVSIVSYLAVSQLHGKL